MRQTKLAYNENDKPRKRKNTLTRFNMDIIEKLTNKKTSREEKNIMNYSRMNMKWQKKN